MSFAIAVRIDASSVRSIARRAAVLKVGDQVHRVGRRAAVAASRAPAPPASRARAQPSAAASSASPPSARVCSRSERHLLRLHQDRAPERPRPPPRGPSPTPRGRDRESSMRRCRGPGRLASLEQAAVLEEDMDELPEHVVESLDELLPDERVRARGSNSHCAAPGPKAIVRHPSSLATASASRVSSRPGLDPVADRDVPGFDHRADLSLQRSALTRERERRKRALAHDHRMDELDRDVTRVRARHRRAPERDEPPPASEALGHRVAAASEPLGLGREEGSIRLGAAGTRARRAASGASLPRSRAWMPQAIARRRPPGPRRASSARPQSPRRCER